MIYYIILETFVSGNFGSLAAVTYKALPCAQQCVMRHTACTVPGMAMGQVGREHVLRALLLER